jgi:hypothetical protein
MSQVTTELVIDADTSGADRFTQAMSGAEQAANSGMQSVSGMNVGLVALGTGALAALVGVKQMVDYVVGANKDLADMATVAHQVGLTLADFQGIQLGGAISGLTDSQINSGLEKSASLLNDAQRNANSLSKELDANGISIKNSNGQLISENQLLGVAADLIKKANSPGDQLAIAQMLGFTKEWIPLLQQGSGAMSGLTDEARKAGAVIDDETVQRASEFDAQWRKSSAEFSANMKASLLSILPFVDDLLDGASKFIKSIDRGKIEAAANEQLKQLGDAAGIPESGGLKLGVTPETMQAINDFKNASVFSLEFWAAAGRAFSSAVQIIKPEDVKWYSGTSAVTDYSGAAQTAQWQSAGDSWKKMQGGFLDGSDKTGSSKVAGRGVDEADDAYDRAINQIAKHTARTLADADAVGKGAGAQEALRAEYQLFAAAEHAGLPITQAMRDKIQDLAQDAGDAALALAKAKVANDNLFGRNTAFLSQSDVQIATQLKGLYPDVAEALNSAEAAQMRFNASARGLSSSIESNLVSGLTDITTGAKSASQGFTDMSNAIIKAIEQMIIKITIVEPMMRALQQAAGGLGIGSVGSLLGSSGVGSYGQVSNATGLGAGTGGLSFPMFADGTDSAPGGWSIVGERGPELLKLPQGAQVLPNGKSPSNDNGGVQNVITYAPNIDARGADAAAVARLASVIATDRQNFERNVQAVFGKTRQNTPGSFR